MRLSADVNTSSNSSNNVPVVLFCYGESRKFVRVSGDYEETLQVICRAFDIPTKNTSTISLTTSALDVCKGRDVVIDESAYPLMWNFLDEMTISVHPDADGSDGITKGKGKAKERVASSSRSAQKAPGEPKPHLPRPSTQENLEEEEQEPAARKPDAFQDDLLDFTSDHQQEQEAEVEDEQPRGERQVEEPVTARAASPDFYSRERHQEEDDQEEERLPVSRTVKKFKKPEPIAGSSASRAADDTFLQVKQERDTDDTSEFSSRRERERERSPKKEAAHNLGPADDPRFEITIISPESTCAQFKTRGKHQVRKVLAAACKTFDIDASRTQLVMRLELDGDEDEFHDFVCSPSETISGCGVTYNSKLFLKEIPEESRD